MEASDTASAGKLPKYHQLYDNSNYHLCGCCHYYSLTSLFMLPTHPALLKESFIGPNVVILRETAQGVSPNQLTE